MNNLPSIQEAQQAKAENVFSMPVTRPCGHVQYVPPFHLIDPRNRAYQENITACFECRKASGEITWTADDQARFMR